MVRRTPDGIKENRPECVLDGDSLSESKIRLVPHLSISSIVGTGTCWGFRSPIPRHISAISLRFLLAAVTVLILLALIKGEKMSKPKEEFGQRNKFIRFRVSEEMYEMVADEAQKCADGYHTLTFRAWDLLNNSTTKSLSFVVEKGLDPSIYSITSYPNPVRMSGTLRLLVNYDQPDELITTEIYLLNTNGQIIWSKTQENPDDVAINIAEVGLNPGIYFYSVRIKSASSKYATSSGKIIVTK